MDGNLEINLPLSLRKITAKDAERIVARGLREICVCSLLRDFKAVPTAPPQWNVSIVIKESGCEDVRCERSKSEDEELKILQLCRGQQEWADEMGADGSLAHLSVAHFFI